MALDLQADADKFLSADDFAEVITYTPSGGVARTIMANVTRKPPEGVNESPGNLAPVIQVAVANRSTAIADDDYGGIGSDEIDTGGDTITVAQRVGQTAVARKIVRVVEHDAGMLIVELR